MTSVVILFLVDLAHFLTNFEPVFQLNVENSRIDFLICMHH